MLNRASTNWASRELDEARAFVAQVEGLTLAETALRDRKAFRTAVSEGLAVTELGRAAKAAAEEAWGLYAELGTPSRKELRRELRQAT